MTAIAKSAKRHPAAKKCYGWEKPAICSSYEHLSSYEVHMNILVHMAGFSQPQHFFAAGRIFAVFGIALIFYPEKETL